MKINTLTQHQKRLHTLKRKSEAAVNIVTTVIEHLSLVNEDITAQINEIEDIKAQLHTTENDLCKTKAHNTKIIDKFKTLLED